MQVSTATAWRATRATGQAALAVCEQKRERLQREMPPAPAGADKQAMSGDGAFVHLVGGEWVEVKTLTLGEITRNKRGEVCLQQISSFSRLADAEHFAEAALVETHRRGVEQASEVCAVQDGAEWLQGLVDYQCADAVRILDFAHAAEYLNEIGQAVQAAGGRLPATWLEGVLHRLKHQGPQRVLKHLAWLAARYPSSIIQEKLAYLQKREAHMQYPSYQAAGWPIGSGSVESANKLVVEARLKGAGMRLPSRERQSHAGAAQRGVQSALARDVDDRGSASTSAAHESTASREPTAAHQRPLDSRLLGSALVSAVPSTCPRCPPTNDSGPRAVTSSSFWLRLFLAQPLSQTPSLLPCAFRNG